MDKNTFLSKFHFYSENEILSIYNKIILADKTHKDIFTSEFYPPNFWKILEDFKGQVKINIYSYGIFENAERKILAFSQSKVSDYPVRLMRIKCSSKFVSLQHKDYLGALMALGIKRGKFGDLIVKENNECYVAVHEDVSDYVYMNLSSIGKCECNLTFLDTNITGVPDYDFKTFDINISSFRIDCLLSSICRISRSKSEELIRQGKVLLDYLPVTKKDKVINDSGCVVTVRGYGKFKVVEKLGYTKRGGCKLHIKKFN
ncbi:YlmH family RNA-binding protein [Clostridium sp.]|uniref:YlmH family RNA-binding protein n=1 Tax=Clostridium sp. TaxID=1506 RepID=UPI002FDD00A9